MCVCFSNSFTMINILCASTKTKNLPKNMKWLIVMCTPVILYFAWYCSILWRLSFVILLSICIVLGTFLLTLWGHVSLSSPHQTPLFLWEKVEKEVRRMEDMIKEDQGNWPNIPKKKRLPIIFGRTVDSQLQLLIDYALRDYITCWFEEYLHKPEPVIDKFKEHLWGGIEALHERLLKVDAEKLIAGDMVTKITQHFEKIRIAKTCAAELNQPPVFALAPHLMAPETELHYLRQISELVVMFLMPRCYSLAPASHLMREVLACKVLQPVINMVTEPDYINQKIVQYLEAQREVDAMHVRTHEYAKTFEDYIRLINSCNNVDTLKRLRYDIVAQTMQATTLQNMKRAKGIDIDAIEKNTTLHNISKQQISDAKKLQRYISQLTVAKAECEGALRKLGWDGVVPTVESVNKSLPLSAVLGSAPGRRRLAQFLESLCSQGLVGYWAAAQELRGAPRAAWHQRGAEIFYTYIRSPSAEIKVDKETKKRMEAFLLGDKGPEVFYEVQETVVDTIQEKYYASFLLSDQYRALLVELDSEEANSELAPGSPPEEPAAAPSPPAALHDHSTYARRKLDQLQERHNNKVQALAALQSSLKPESRALSVLAEEVARLEGERTRLEAHLARTDTWAEHLGRWGAVVHSAEIVEESKPPQFVIVVHMAAPEPGTSAEAGAGAGAGTRAGAGGGAEAGDARPDHITTGWVLLRTLQEFQDLDRKLRPMCSELKNIELPSNSFKFIFGKNDKNNLEKAKILIQKYLEFVLEDDRLNQSEALYTFLNPSSEYLKQGGLPKKNKFSFSTLFKSTSSEGSRGSLEREPPPAPGGELSLDEPPAAAARGAGAGGAGGEERDGAGEPLYALLGELCELRGLFRWLRRTLVTFVQITYGRTINRQIKETLCWLSSESMLHYYCGAALAACWPGGARAQQPPPRGDEDKEHTARLARPALGAALLRGLGSLVGAPAAARAAHSLFHALQHPAPNKQLFYELLELVLVEVFPELRRYH